MVMWLNLTLAVCPPIIWTTSFFISCRYTSLPASTNRSTSSKKTTSDFDTLWFKCKRTSMLQKHVFILMTSSNDVTNSFWTKITRTKHLISLSDVTSSGYFRRKWGPSSGFMQCCGPKSLKTILGVKSHVYLLSLSEHWTSFPNKKEMRKSLIMICFDFKKIIKLQITRRETLKSLMTSLIIRWISLKAFLKNSIKVVDF